MTKTNYILNMGDLTRKDYKKAISLVKHYRRQVLKNSLIHHIKIKDTKIKTSIILQFNQFFKIKFKHGKPILTKTKVKKLHFFDHFILNNRSFFVKDYSGVQLCTTSIAKNLGVSPETVMNWIKTLLKLNHLHCNNWSWSVTRFARRYRINDLSLLMLMNRENGYCEKYKIAFKQSVKNVINKSIQIKALRNLSIEIPSMKQLCQVAQQFLNRPEDYMAAIHRRCKRALLRPSDQKHVKHLETFMGTAIRAFNRVQKHNKKNNKIKYDLVNLFRKKYKNPLFFACRKSMSNYYNKRFKIIPCSINPCTHSSRSCPYNQQIKFFHISMF